MAFPSTQSQYFNNALETEHRSEHEVETISLEGGSPVFPEGEFHHRAT
jgi:hypothetical protein